MAGNRAVLLPCRVPDILRADQGFRPDKGPGWNRLREIRAGVGDGAEPAFQMNGFPLPEFREEPLFQLRAAGMHGINGQLLFHLPLLLFRERRKLGIDGRAEGIPAGGHLPARE